jgi:hypothetical protein
MAALLRMPPRLQDLGEAFSAEAKANMKVRTLAVLAALFAALIAIAGYVARRPSCESE